MKILGGPGSWSIPVTTASLSARLPPPRHQSGVCLRYGEDKQYLHLVGNVCEGRSRVSKVDGSFTNISWRQALYRVATNFIMSFPRHLRPGRMLSTGYRNGRAERGTNGHYTAYIYCRFEYDRMYSKAFRHTMVVGHGGLIHRGLRIPGTRLHASIT